LTDEIVFNIFVTRFRPIPDVRRPAVSGGSPTSSERADASARSLARPSAVEKVMDAVTREVRRGTLPPGQPIRQEDLAARLQVSRSPVREALKALEAEGLLCYQRNVGYEVARLSVDELSEIYLMRRLLERELVLRLPAQPASAIDELRALNDQLAKFAQEGNVFNMMDMNRRFHFAIYEAAGLGMVVREVKRLWDLSDGYRALYLYDGEARSRVVKEHEGIIEAVRSHNLELLSGLMSEHQRASEDRVTMLLQHRSE
jgi:DNA-binding GntR family transcriptional regulator